MFKKTLIPSIYRPRRPRASPLWQIVHVAWDEFIAHYESRHRKTHGPLRRDTVAVVDQFYRCGDLAAGFTRLQCPDCGHEKLLAFTCKSRHFCPSCHQRRVRALGDWIAHDVCFEVPHRQFVFTMPRPLRGIFRKRRKLLDHLFRVSIECLRDWMRTRLDLPDGQLAAVAAAQTFGDYLNFHPHLHVLAATGLVDREGRFHLMPVESIEPLTELFRHRFIEALLREKLISEKKARQLLGWTHSGFSLERWYVEKTAVKKPGVPVSFPVAIENPDQIEDARLVVGLHRYGGISENFGVKVNGTEIEVDPGDSAEFSEFFAPLDAELPVEILKQENVVTLQMQEGTTITSVQIVTQSKIP